MLLLWSVACPVSVSGREERGSKPDQPEFWETLLVLFWVQKEKPSTMSFAVGSGPKRCLHWWGGGAWARELLGWLKGPGLLEPKWGCLRLGGGVTCCF